MKRIAILSDTHGLLRPEVTARLESCDVILHAGDVDSQAVTDFLRSCARTYMVRGNNDREWAKDLPHDLLFTIEDIRFFMVHNKKDIRDNLPDADVIIYGHSHKFAMENRDGALWLNPGSCGKRRFNQEITFCMMEADHGQYQVEKITITGGKS